MPLFPSYCFAHIALQWHDIKQAPGVVRIVRAGGDEPARIPDQVIAAIRSRERNGALDLPTRRNSRSFKIGDRVQITDGLFGGCLGVCAGVTQQRVDVLLFMFGAQRQVKLNRSAVVIV